ncbi:unnamed protein product [Brachionus calyciflorus]|uniref:Integrase zinc-binding domain-containing protein n=1 Tax=Brachionus calyciflorus TaxID=104777 RepID=A0A814EUP6_9BILA|nr:unnamed protein product [Brachionus calyciflorus]
MSDKLNDERKLAHKNAFEQFMKEQYDKEESTSLIIDRKKYDMIVSYLTETVEKPDPCKKFHLKKQKFNIQIIDDQTKIYREFKKRNNTMNLPVAVKEDYFEILYDIHSVQRGHIGINKMEHQLSIRYYGIPRFVLAQFIKFCPIYNLKHVQTSQPRLNPIRSDDFLSRFQIDLVGGWIKRVEYTSG